MGLSIVYCRTASTRGGLLFVNFEKPHRLRLQGIASIDDNDPLLQEYAEAQLVVRVTVSEIFRNCPRYVHRYTKTKPSEYVPRATCETPLAPWKRVDDMQASLPAKDRARVEQEGGVMSRAEYEKYLAHLNNRDLEPLRISVSFVRCDLME